MGFFCCDCLEHFISVALLKIFKVHAVCDEVPKALDALVVILEILWLMNYFW